MKKRLFAMEEDLQAAFGDRYIVKVVTVQKRNMPELTGVRIADTSQNPCLGVTIYPECAADAPDAQLTQWLKDTYAKLYTDDRAAFLKTQIPKTKDELLARVRCQLMNTEKNRDLLKKFPHKEFLDLSIYYYYPIEEFIEQESEPEFGSMNITHDIAKWYRIQPSELEAAARQNTMADGFSLYSLETVTHVLSRNGTLDSVEGEIWPKNSEWYHLHYADLILIVPRNRARYGATGILCDGLLRDVSEFYGDDVVVIPSSVQEILTCPYRMMNTLGVECFKTMICAVNENKKTMSPENVLSGHPYVWHRDTGKLEICA